MFLLNTEESDVLSLFPGYIWVQYWLFPNTGGDMDYFYLAIS